jgi:hypothetical protein
VLELALPQGQTVEYRLVADGVERRLRSDGVEQHREIYRVRPLAEKGWTLTAHGTRWLVTVYLQQQLELISGAPHGLAPVRIDAALGLMSLQQPVPVPEK